MIEFRAYCQCVDEKDQFGLGCEYYHAFEAKLKAPGVPRNDDEISIEGGPDGEFACEMIVCHAIWHMEDGVLIPMLYLRPNGGCAKTDFVGLGWKSA